MSVPVSWVLAQHELALTLQGGAAGVDREVDLVLTTELVEPFRWLSGRELVLTTGLRLTGCPDEQASYLRGLDVSGVGAVGFGIGLTHDELPVGLIACADQIGLPVFEVPLRTPFAAIVKRVNARMAELRYDAVLRASRTQPRMTRAAVRGGARAIVKELGRSLSADVVVANNAGELLECSTQTLNAALLKSIRAAIASGTSAGVSSTGTQRTITHQTISVGRRSYGVLVVVTAEPLSHVDQILLGHANSLLALDFEKPARLKHIQEQLNTQALGMLLASDVDRDPAWTQVAAIADGRNRIRALAVEADASDAVDAVHRAVLAAAERAGHPAFVHATAHRLIALLPGDEDVTFAHRLLTDMSSRARRLIRIGLSGPHPLGQLSKAVDNGRLAAAAAQTGGPPLEFAALTGRALLSSDAARQVLDAVADTMLNPLEDHDLTNGTELMAALRAFLEANGHWETAAAATGVHRHTLRKRVNAAEALLGCNLDNARVRAELLLTILSRRH